MRPAVVFVFALLLGVSLCMSVLATGSFDLAAKGTKQGDIAGAGKTISVDAFSYEFVSPRDAASGLPTGAIMNRPLRIHKAIDATSPKLMAALVTNENLPSVILTFPDAGGVQGIKLTNAAISSIKGSKGPGNVPASEDVTFTYATFEYLTNTTTNKTRPAVRAPFNVTIDPPSATVGKGKNVKYLIRIEADKGFNDPVNLTLKLKDAALVGDMYDLGPYGPPFPFTLNYTFLVPSNIPFGIDLVGEIQGTSGAYLSAANMSVTIEGPVKFLGNGLNWLFSVPSKVGNWFA